MKLKLFNGRGHGKYGRGYHLYVAARSIKHCSELVSMACYDGKPNLVSYSEISTYYSKGSWGNSMKGIEPENPCVYAQYGYAKKPFKIL